MWRTRSPKTKRRAVQASPFPIPIVDAFASRLLRRRRRWLGSRRTRRSGIREVYLGHLTRPRVRHLEIRLLLRADHLCGEHSRKAPDVGVVLLGRLIVIATSHGNPVLGSGQLILQPQETLVRLELRIRFGDREQPA